MTIHLMVIDNNDLVRAGLVQYFEKQPDIQVVAEAANGEELLGKLKTTQADILLLDMVMPGTCGADLIFIIKSRYPDLRILVFSMYDEIKIVSDAMNAGASGYILKNCPPHILLEAVREVMLTGNYLTQNMAQRLESAVGAVNGKLKRNNVPDADGCAELQETTQHTDDEKNLDSTMPITWQPKNQPEYAWPNCQVSVVNNTDLIECLQKIIGCQWMLAFGNKRYCKHPSVKSLLKSALT